LNNIVIGFKIGSMLKSGLIAYVRYVKAKKRKRLL